MSIDAIFQSGLAPLLVLGVMILEVIVLWSHITRMPVIIAGIGAGAALVLALRAALIGQGWPVIAVFLTISFMLHIVEVRQWLRLEKRLQH